MPRLFYAIHLPCPPGLEEVLDRLHAVRDEPVVVTPGKPGLRIKPVRRDGLHLTLRFLGAVEERRVAELGEALEAAVRDAGVTPFDLRLEGLACLPPRGRPNVLFAGVADPTPLEALERALACRLGALAAPVRAERRPYRPHLTLARFAPARRIGSGKVRLDALLPPKGGDLGCVHLEVVHLFESELRPEGPVYNARHTSRLPAGR